MTASRQAAGTGRPYPAGRRDGPRHRGIAVAAALMAVAAVAGAVGLTGGRISLGEPITQRLPLQSPVLGGAALLAIVALPMSAAAVAAWQGASRAAEIVTAAAWRCSGGSWWKWRSSARSRGCSRCARASVRCSRRWAGG